REVAELELVRGDDVCDRHHPVAQEVGDRGGDEASGLRVAHHWIARVHRRGVRGLHPGDGVDDDLGDALAALISREHCVDLPEDAAFLDAGQHLTHIRGVDHRAAPCAVAGVVREVHRVDGQDLDADALQGEDRRRIADMAVGDGGLDREDLHPSILAPRRRPADRDAERGGTLSGYA
ncbi:hypothetical protein ABE10_02295, partial [Bacillus toyonensis]|nr:hypothetical protein [Bacillus toyonensis]